MLLARPRKLAHSQIKISVKHMDKFEEKDMMKKSRFTKNTWYDWLIHFISDPEKLVGGIKEKIIDVFKRSITEDYKVE